MKKIFVAIIIAVALLTENFCSYADDKNDTENINSNSNFICYKVTDEIFDIFLDNIENISVLKDNPYEFSEENKEGALYFGANDPVSSDVMDYLSDPNNIYYIASELGINSQIYDYCFIAVIFYDWCFDVPLTLWLNTSDGIKLIGLSDYRGDIVEPTVFNNNCYVKLYSLEEYKKQYGLNDAKVIVNDKVVEMPYAVIRNEGGRLCLREALEAVGFTVDWKQESDTTSSVSVYIPGKEGYPAKLIIDETNGFMKMESLKDGDSMEYYLHIHGNRCRFINDKIIITNIQLSMLLKLYDYSDADYNIDYENGVINVKYVM